MRGRAGAPLLLLLAAALGCEEPVVVGKGFEPVLDLPSRPVRALDVLFVVDTSNSMAEEQADLAASLGRFVQALNEQPGGPFDLHIGVISSDLGTAPNAVERCDARGDGDGGRLRGAPGDPGCPAVDGRYLVDVAGGPGSPRVTNYPAGQLDEALACMARLGTLGCGFEQPFAAMRQALDGSNPDNAGFLRPDAVLAVFFVTDEDDCSAFDPALFDPRQDDRGAPLGELASFRCFEFGVECRDGGDPRRLGGRTGCRPADQSRFMTPVGRYADFLQELKESLALVVVGGIFGDAEPIAVEVKEERLALVDVCPGAGEAASPAVRLHALAAAVASPGAVASLCEPDPAERSTALALSAADAVRGTHCLRRQPRDAEPDRAGLQPACRAFHTIGRERRELPVCEGAAPDSPCFAIVPDTEICAFTPSRLRFRVNGPVDAADGGRLRLECLTEKLDDPKPVD